MAVIEKAVTESVDLDALEADAQRTLGELTEARSRLALDALTDAAVAGELANVESEIGACERALSRMDLARAEQGRRDAATAAAAEAARCAAALHRARELGVARLAAAGAVDDALVALAAAVRAWLAACDEQAVELAAAGRAESSGAARGRMIALEGAVRAQLSGLPIQLDGTMPVRSQRPLVDGDARPVGPVE